MEAKQSPVLGRKLFLYATAFFSGMSVMAIELGASRLLAPYFSSSQIVWTVIIGTIMIAMAIGNVWGGRAALADRRLDGGHTLCGQVRHRRSIRTAGAFREA